MIILLSPAKSLDFESPISCKKSTQHFFQKESDLLAAKLKKLSTTDLEKLMDISPKLAELNHERFQNFADSKLRQALLAFDGDVYDPINARELKEDDLLFAQDSVRILSGLYGLLRPLDLIHPYRLEMGTSFVDAAIFKKIGVKNLYNFWEGKIGEKIEEELKNTKSQALINLASEEYSKAVQRNKISVPIIDIHFKENVKGALKTIGIKAKRARGLMTKFVIENRISKPVLLKDFKEEGYDFAAKLSSEKEMVFVR